MALTEKLIEIVKLYPIIYDLSHEDYKNVRKNDKVWEQIGLELKENGEDLKKKWKNLRDSYAKHLRSLKTVTGQSAKKLQKWQWAGQMETFRPFMSFSKTTSNITDITSEEHTDGESIAADDTSPSPLSRIQQDELTLDIAENMVHTRTEEASSSHETPISVTKSIRKTNSNKRIKRIEETDSPTEKVISYLKEKQSQHKDTIPKMDAIDLIFSGYAAIVKTFSPRMQIISKLKLAQIMSQLELEHEQEIAASSTSHPSTRCSSRNSTAYITPLLSPTSMETNNSASGQCHDTAFEITNSCFNTNRNEGTFAPAYNSQGFPIFQSGQTTELNPPFNESSNRSSSLNSYFSDYNPSSSV